ncbi:hypothetical protein JAO29_20355 [Edaphobacter sp. HDX4]|uniref:hypothetical protein n=1 Tax=Edaphobacter sp. HDX4 TaxID=2794064 RepID=UPI002FE5F547
MPRYWFVLVTLIAFLLTGCSGNNNTPAPAAPVFTSTPGTQATEGSPYSYQLATSATAVTFSLSNAPTGATLSGNSLSWTPTAQQSRTSNSFTVTATASGGASATQSWSVTPSGTIRISHIDTLWDENGSTNKAFDWTPINSYVAALVPQPDGSFRSLSGTAGANGTFEIPNVPAGHYWLKLGLGETYWTSSSIFDAGSDIFVSTVNPPNPTLSTTYINFSFTSLDPTAAPAMFQFDALETPLPAYRISTTPGSTTFSAGVSIGSNLDFSSIKNAFVRQYEPAAFGPMAGYVMGPSLMLSNLSLATGGPNTLSGALSPTVPASINLSVKGSAWASLSDHIAPTAPTALGGSFNLSVQSYISADGPNVSSSKPIDLLWTGGNGAGGNCPGGNLTSGRFSDLLISPTNPPLTTDVEAGAVQYSDPFPSAWRRTFRVCQTASVAVPMPGGSTQNFDLTNIQTTSLPTTTVKPLISPVQNPKINGDDLFTAATINGTAVTLSWDPPAIGAPYGYTVAIMSPTTSPGGTSPGGTLPVGTPPGTIVGTITTFPGGTPPGTITGTIGFFPLATLSAAKTSMTVPPDLLSSGKTYLFVITSLVDGKANMETSPHRSSLPTADAQLISAPITITN